ncbi:MAG: tetratricopeptide repeat protein [Rhodovarius sp.]|nr:tetratricopeptide repeat protein [Rhodovarius sp.]
MRELLLFFAAGALLGAGVAWISGLGGDVEVRFGEWLIAAPLALAAFAVAVFFLFGHGLLAGLAALLRRPAWRALRLSLDQRAQADRALTEALVKIALGAPAAAREAAERACRLSGGQPVTLLVAAAAERLAGQEEAAAAHYRKLAADPATRILGLRGLIRQARLAGDREAELALRAAAEALQPGAGRIDSETAERALAGPDLQAALEITPPEAPRAERLLAEAAAATSAEEAARLEREAFAADPGFAPAAIAHAARLSAAGHEEAARAVLEVAWAAAPHPDLAFAYLGAETDGHRRLAQAQVLARHHPHHRETRLMLARAHLGAGELAPARRLLEELLAEGPPDRRVHQAMAELCRREGDVEGAARHLDLALAAPLPAVWSCSACGAEVERWVPACRACGAALAVRWGAKRDG